MPRQVVTAPEHDRDRSLGWLALAWLEHFVVHGPGDAQGEPVRHGDEYSGFVADCYALSRSGRRLYDSAFLSRPKGCDKSGLIARIALFEALGPCRFAGWAKKGDVFRDPWGMGFEYPYEPGEPKGRVVKTPFIRCMATEEGQTGNVYDSVYFNLTEGPLAKAMPRRDNAGLTRIFLPGGGEIMPSTASSSAKDGGKETFVGFDETHLYKTPELRRMYGTVTRNLRKRKKIAETWFLEGTTMFAPGQESIAEATYQLAELIKEGRTKRARLLFDHQWGECEDLADEAALREALVEAYGDAIEWNDLDGLVDEFMDVRSAPADSRRYFLNAPTSAADAYVAEHEWTGCKDTTKQVQRGDVITVGFDGSRRRARGVTDATALIGTRVSDGHQFEIRVWEQPPDKDDWQVPIVEVDAEVDATFSHYKVVAFYGDPAKWESQFSTWQARYGDRVKVKVTRDHPFEWWMTGGRATATVKAIAAYLSAIVEKEMTHDGSAAFTRHVLNARRRDSKAGMQIAKEHPDSPNKIDACVAGVLSWQARLDALAKGVGKKQEFVAPVRIR